MYCRVSAFSGAVSAHVEWLGLFGPNRVQRQSLALLSISKCVQRVKVTGSCNQMCSVEDFFLAWFFSNISM